MATLAQLEDLVAIGALRADEASTTERYGRAARLLELASAQVVAYIDPEAVDEAAVIAGLTSPQKSALAAIVAELAGRRLNASAAPSNEYGVPEAGWSSIRMTRADCRAVDRALKRRGSRTIDTGRAEGTSFVPFLTNSTGSQW